MTDNVTITPKTRELVDRLLSVFDKDTRIKRTFKEATLLELALIVLDNSATQLKADYTIEYLLAKSVIEFEGESR